MKRWFKNLWNWLAEAQDFWYFLLLSLLIVFLVVFMGSSKLAFRVAGMLLQLLGVFTVFLGIQKTRELFGHPSLTFRLRQWFRSFPRFAGRTITASPVTHVSGLATGADGRTSAKVDPNASVESRIEILEKNIEYLYNRIDATERQIDGRFLQQATALREEEKTRESKDQQIRAKLEATETGGLHISAMVRYGYFSELS